MRRIMIIGKPATTFLASISLFTLATSGMVVGHITQAQAQTMPPKTLDSVFVDISDPNITIDLSVIEDGGRAPLMTVPTRPLTGRTVLSSHTAQYRSPKFPTPNTQAPQVDVPISTLYIQPSTNRRLPPQTKPLIMRPAPKLSIAEAVPVAPVSKPTPAKPVVTAKSVRAVTKTASTAAPTAATKAPKAPDIGPVVSASQTTPNKTPITKTAQVKTAQVKTPTKTKNQHAKTKIPSAPPPVSAPITKVTKAVPAKPVVNVKAKETVKVAAATKAPHKTANTTPAPPPPPPQALTKTALAAPKAPAKVSPVAPTQAPVVAAVVTTPPVATPPTAPHAKALKTKTSDETQTAPSATGNSVVVDLPPRGQVSSPNVASVPPASAPLGDGDNMRIVFDQDSSKLPQDARQALKALSKQLQGKDNLRLQLLAYAGNADTSASAARRLSLSRALAVRSYLIESGVRSTRIDVRALGNKSSDEVTERVDITVVER